MHRHPFLHPVETMIRQHTEVVLHFLQEESKQ